MSRRNHSLLAVLVLCALLAFADKPAKASIPTNGQVAGIAIGVAAAGAAIGIGIYYAVHHNRSVTGCATSGPAGMTLTNDSDGQAYMLTGAISSIEPGHRVRVSGKKSKPRSGGTRQFLVDKLTKDFGACKVAAGNPNTSR